MYGDYTSRIFFVVVCRDYASGVDLRLKSRNMLTVINILPSEDYLQRATDDVLRRGLPYNIIITAQNELHRSITLKILHGTPQGNELSLLFLCYVHLSFYGSTKFLHSFT